MKSTLLVFALLVVIGVTAGCNKDNGPVQAKVQTQVKTPVQALEHLPGAWKYIDTDTAGADLYGKVVELDSACNGMHLKPDGTMFKRCSIGDCATPPLTYGSYPGTWEMTSDSIIKVSTKNWFGPYTYKLKIISISESALKVKMIENSRGL